MLKFETPNENKINSIFFSKKCFGPYLMQRSLQKNMDEPIALVTPCLKYEEVCSKLSLQHILLVFVVWTCYKNI